MSEVLKRRAAYTALSRHFENDDLLDAMMLWQTSFARAPESALSDMVKTISDTFGEKETYQALYRDFRECQGLAEYLLHEDPLERLKSYAANKSGVQDAPARTFGVMIVQIGRSLDLIEHPDLPTKIRKALISEGAEKDAARTVETMIREDKARRIPEASLGGYSAAIHVLYVVLCEALGPVPSDEILSNAVQAVDGSKYGRAYSAQNFL